MVKARAIAILVLAAATAQSAVFAAPGYRLNQTSEFYGDSVAEVSSSALRLHSSKLGLTLAIAKPDFKLQAVNDKSKQYAILPLEHWRAFVLNARPNKLTTEFVKRGHTRIAGLEVDEFWVNAAQREDIRDKSKKDLWFKGKSYNTHYWVTKQIAPPKECFQLFAGGLGMPSYLGMPVRMVQYTAEGRPFVTFDTAKATPCNVVEKLAVPKGYTVAPDEMTLMMGGTDKAALADLLDDDDDAAGDGKKVAAKPRNRGWVPGMTFDDSKAAPAARASRAKGSWVPGW